MNALKFIDTFDPFIKTSTAKGLTLNIFSYHFFIGVSSGIGDLTSNQTMALMGDRIESSASELSSSETECESETENELESETGSEEEMSDEDEEQAVMGTFVKETLLYEGAPITVSASYLMLFFFVKKFNLTLEGFQELLDLVKCHCPQVNKCASFVYKLKRYFNDMFGEEPHQMLRYCSVCCNVIREGTTCSMDGCKG